MNKLINHKLILLFSPIKSFHHFEKVRQGVLIGVFSASG